VGVALGWFPEWPEQVKPPGQQGPC
jgi:hypothetical protein